MYGLLDCNNFYASCETAFNPNLMGRAVVVLSNNDGCVIARSQTAKKLGIKMGTPAFEIKSLIQSGAVVAFSSNYQLYGDMSRRVMMLLRSLADFVEVYSIDEAFFHVPDGIDYQAYGRRIANTVRHATGISVSVGIAKTKTLAKVANHIAKKYPGYKKVCVIETEHQRQVALNITPIDDVWGIGRQYAARLNTIGIDTALQFANLDNARVRRMMTVVGEKTWCELNGQSCIDLETNVNARHQICNSRSFGVMLNDINDIMPAVATFAARCAEKLRRDNLYAGTVMPFINTNRFRTDLPQCYLSQVMLLPTPTNDSRIIVRTALTGLNSIFRTGFEYKKAGVIVSDIITERDIQPDLFGANNVNKATPLMTAVDSVNQKYGRGTMRIAAELIGSRWKNHTDKLSGHYTTDINDIIEIKCDK